MHVWSFWILILSIWYMYYIHMYLYVERVLLGAWIGSEEVWKSPWRPRGTFKCKLHFSCFSSCLSIITIIHVTVILFLCLFFHLIHSSVYYGGEKKKKREEKEKKLFASCTFLLFIWFFFFYSFLCRVIWNFSRIIIK